ncbi:unnamed protein product [Angiostrongylus costaricensis]|uniref:Secreted protein n=1 Tax=Angiostrongylus costaricensis TaxID=334426 RepID=A0A0R3PLA7_ANGCS|nr:unnamed protein product [Angiostrongylus costaricensis]
MQVCGGYVCFLVLLTNACVQAGDMDIKDTSDEMAMELRMREAKETKSVLHRLDIRNDGGEQERHYHCFEYMETLKEVLPVVRQRCEALLKQRNTLAEKINKLRESLDLSTYTTKSDPDDNDVKTANSFSLEALEYSNVSTCSPLPSQVGPHL